MIFSEIYGVYYKAVADILNLTVKGKLTKTDMRECVMKYGFSESLLRIEPAIFEEQWKLVKKMGLLLLSTALLCLLLFYKSGG